MRVLQVVADGRPGGGTSVVLDLAAAARSEGWASSLCTDAGSSAARSAAAIGDEVLELPWFELSRLPELRRRLDRWLGDRRPDVVHLHGSRAAFAAAPLVALHPEVRFHYTVHGLHFEHRHPLRRWIGRRAERWATRRLRSRVFVCRHDLELARRRRVIAPDADCRVIFNGVDVDSLTPSTVADRSGAIFVGRLVPQKNPLLAAEILAAAAALGVPGRIVGGGPMEPSVRRRLRDSPVPVSGSVPRSTALAALAGAEILVLPSRWEGLPVVVLEAMALGVTVMAARVGGVPEAVAHDEGGWLVDGADPRRWTEELVQLQHDRQRRENWVEAARQRVVRDFSWQRCRDGYLALWRGAGAGS